MGSRKGITNFGIEKTIKIAKINVIKKFYWCFSIDHINNFINIHKLMTSKGMKYSYLISGRSDQHGTH